VTIIAIAVTLIMAGVLLRAAVEKVRDLRPTAATMRALGVPDGLASVAAASVTAAELSVAAAVLFRPDATPTHLGIVALAAAFALAGLLALRRDEPIRCNCFGPGSGDLGKTQLLALAPWLGGVAVLRLGFAEAPDLSRSALCFAATSLSLVAIRLLAVRKAWLEARGDRRSAQEMYAWLPSY
jgi:hypothetical protein